MTYLLVMAAVFGLSLWLASRTNRAAKARHDSIVSWRRDLELRSDADVERAGALVQAYAAVLARQRSTPQQPRRASDLPASKEQIAAALFAMARFARTRDPSNSEALRTLAADYGMLGEFVADEEAALGVHDHAALQKSAVECARRIAEFTAFLAEPPTGPASPSP